LDSLIALKVLRAIKIGRAVRLRAADLEAFARKGRTTIQ
jgi:hypothetical protein